MAGEARRQRMRALLAVAGVPHAASAPNAVVDAFEAAFVHESAVKEKLAPRSNERLEFLGDAILGVAVARSLYERYPEAREGELALRKSSLVSDASLAASAERLGFEPLLVLGAGLANLPPARRRSALADAFEAFLAVLQRECGWPAVEAFVMREHVAERERLGGTIDDPKTVLQEWSQRHCGAVPSYVDRFEGPEHERTFHVEVSVHDVCASGSGPSKKEAQRAAAAAALALLAERFDDVEPRALSRAKTTSSEAAQPNASRKRPRKTSRAGVAKKRHA
ncbi:MAG: ribonuclease III [Candidatus Eremiobacteraeota bacterium]|nr:ribonuclease III [Candidatus Eremiobacteraeota bacterium]